MSTKTGPQIYPGASRRYWFQDEYRGDDMEVNVVVLHTTEGLTVPGYDGGASAPNLTLLPSIASQRAEWYQHYEVDVSSRALQNLRGGVTTNTNNVVQVELVGTCDPKNRESWRAGGKVYKAGVDYIYWPDAPDWLLLELARFIAWCHEYHGVPLTGPQRGFLAYPGSYANGKGQRMSFAEWNAFRGICGHQHVPENDHGDPGNINFARIMELARGDVGTPNTPPPTPQRPAFPGRKYFAPGAYNDYVTQLGRQLVKKGFGRNYREGPGPRWGEADRLNVRDFQRSRPELSGDADGYPGPLTWQLLFA